MQEAIGNLIESIKEALPWAVAGVGVVGCVVAVAPNPMREGDVAPQSEVAASMGADGVASGKVEPEVSARDAGRTRTGDDARRSDGRLVFFEAGGVDIRVRAAQAAAGTTGNYDDYLARKRRHYDALKASFLREAKGAVQVVEDFRNLPILNVAARSVADVSWLARLEGVGGIEPISTVTLTLAESGALIGQPQAEASGFVGEGVSIAILDSGVDYTHEAFGACDAPGPDCPVIHNEDLYCDDGPGADYDRFGVYHGTAMAGVALSVAPGVNIVSVDMDGECEEIPEYSLNVVFAGIDWVIENKEVYNIEVLSLSHGTYGNTADDCSATTYGAAIEAAYEAGIVSVVPGAGILQYPHHEPGEYDYYLYTPGCVPRAVTVGSVYDADFGLVDYGDLEGRAYWGEDCIDPVTGEDVITCYTSPNPQIDILAPGSIISGSTLWTNAYGHSLATVQVSAAMAILAAAYPEESIDERVERMVHTGVPVYDDRHDYTYPRLNLAAAVDPCFQTVDETSVVAHYSATTASINVGDPCSDGWLATTDADWIHFNPGASGAGDTTLSLEIDENTWAPREATVNVAGYEITVSQGQDLAGVGTPTFYDSALDFVAPHQFIGSCSMPLIYDIDRVQVGYGGPDADLEGNDDAPISPASYCYLNEERAVAEWGFNTPLDALGFTIFDSDLDNDTPSTVTLEVFDEDDVLLGSASVAVDPAANTAEQDAGAIFLGISVEIPFVRAELTTSGAGGVAYDNMRFSSESIRLEQMPEGTITINGGAESTNDRLLSVTVDASSDQPLTAICYDTEPECDDIWRTYTTEFERSVTAANGVKTLYVWVGDIDGHITGPITDTIILDTEAPFGGALTAEAGDTTVALSWGGFYETATGIDSYKLVYSTSGSPKNCDKGIPIYEGTDTVFTHTGLTNGLTHTYRVCPIDGAANMGLGVFATAFPLPETAAPTGGSVVIEGDAAYVNNSNVTVTLSADDDSEVSAVCLSNTTTCTSWKAFAPSMKWTLKTNSGTRTVYAWFKDEWGNETTEPVSDSVFLDMTAPANGAVSAVGGDDEIALTWDGFSDGHSGLAGYKLVYGGSSAPSSCGKGTLLYEGEDHSYTDASVANGQTRSYRLCAMDAAGNLSSGVVAEAKAAPELDPPADGSVTIDGGAAYSRSTSVTLALSATDASTVKKVCLSNSTSCSTWKGYAESLSWNLSGRAGINYVYAWFQDEWGNTTSTWVRDDIYLDVSLPKDGAVEASPGDGQIALSWSGFVDKQSGLAGYKLVYGGSSSPANCKKGNLAYEGSDTSFVDTGIANGTGRSYRLCAVDNAGNLSAGVTVMAVAAPEQDAPTGASISIDADAAYTSSTAVTLTLAASDESTVSHVCLSNATTCSSWKSMADTRSWTLSSGTGVRKVYAWFRDEWGNETSSPVMDDIYLDSTLPVDGDVALTPSDSQVALSWSGFSDKHSGLVGYRLVVGGSSSPSNCMKGTTIYEGSDTSFTDDGITNGTQRFYRLCGVDAAGNLSAGVAASVTVAPEVAPPADGSVVINDDADYARATGVTLSLSAVDASTVTRVCISNSNSCSSWKGMSDTRSWTLTSGTGQRTVYVWFKDEWGNATSEPVTDTIYLDTTLPKDGSLTVDPSDGEIALSWSGFSDKHSGLAGYRVVYGGKSSPSHCNGGTVAYEGALSAFVDTGVPNGTSRYYRLCAVDNAGNLSAGVVGMGTAAPEHDAPTSGSIVIDDDAEYATSTSVVVGLSATDASAVSEVCLSNTSSCSTWKAMSESKKWTLTAGTGRRTVYAWFRDEWGNATSAPVTDDLFLDMTVPKDGSLVATPGDGQVALSWSGFSDKHSGLAGYRLVFGSKGYPANCKKGNLVYEGEGTTYVDETATNGKTRYYRLCARDVAGNLSLGVMAQAIAGP